jgi:hypothetical protein
MTLENKPFYLDEIFEINKNDINYTKDAELFQDILRYFNIELDKVEINNNNNLDNKKEISISVRTQPEAFTIRDLENWLIKKIDIFFIYIQVQKQKHQCFLVLQTMINRLRLPLKD